MVSKELISGISFERSSLRPWAQLLDRGLDRESACCRELRQPWQHSLGGCIGDALHGCVRD